MAIHNTQAVKLILIRHTRVDSAGLCYGKFDVPLNANWPKHFAEVKHRLQTMNLQPPQVFSSPSRRCLELAQFCFDPTQVTVDKRIAELDFGHWEGQLWDSIPRAELDQWATDVHNYSIPGGESVAAMTARVRSFLDHLRTSPVVCFSHGGVIRTIWALKEGIPVSQVMDRPVDYGAIVEVDFEPG